MDFSSDTSAPAHPRVIEALAAANHGQAPSYGGDALTRRVEETLRERFECDLRIWLVASGTAANALSLALLSSPVGAILCHAEAHIQRDERGAPEFYTGGGRLMPLSGAHGKIDLDALDAVVAGHDPNFFHATPAEALSVTNLTESGTAYTADELGARIERARSIGCGMHLDGARFANALVADVDTGATLADGTWKLGVDVLSLGFTKTGALGCEAIVVFDPARVHGAPRATRQVGLEQRFTELRARAKRAGHVPAKLRYLAAQADALLADELWLTLARTANERARELAAALQLFPGVALAEPVEGNEVLARIPDETATRLRAAGAKFYPWSAGSQRFVCSWATSADEIAAVRELA